MSDIVSKEKRSSMMAAVRQKGTEPELNLRRALHRAGLRYRLHRRDLPGTPDIVIAPSRVAVFVHGCFWHRHAGCPKTTTPATRAEFWLDKFEKNVARDRRAQASLRAAGWKVFVVWECEVKSINAARDVANTVALAARTKARVLTKRMLRFGKGRTLHARRKSL
ncbi:DNA mismatch endonuclease Vsr [Bradyrhizobium sp. AUGA SZCCT0177]|uniref:very short patch repair endonuclease n=1 Tax=Bradyrhizobium sp. AUGA SZCCT0177 TaxID=2807665 RepID=UPI001BA840DE|nr:DNA mismatch endonuclease Vsr [Bradyrhizobium sp. AUGA SZCCT0177]